MPKKEWVVDAAGNKVLKGSKTDPEMAAKREAARVRREAKAIVGSGLQ
jgi:hypothetical protein